MSRDFEVTIKVSYDEGSIVHKNPESAILRNMHAHTSAHMLEYLDGQVASILDSSIEVHEIHEPTAREKECMAMWLDTLEDILDDMTRDEPYTHEELLAGLKEAAREKK